MKKIITSIFAFYALATTAQNNFLLPDSSNQVIINSAGGVASSSIPQKFMNKFIFPDFIDNDLKDEASSNMKDNNFFGGAAGGSFNVLFSALNDTSKTSNLFGIGFGTTMEGNLRFTKDLFDVTFYGNQPFAGESLDLSNTNFNYNSYSFLEFSLGKSKVTPKAHSSIWIDLGVIAGHAFTDFDLGDATLFTEQDGDYLELDIAGGTIAFSDTISTNLVQGYGAKLDFHYSKQTETSKLLFSAQNMGGIYWLNSSKAEIDTVLNFEGIEIGNIFQLSDSVWKEVESIDSIVSTKKEDSFRGLPVDFTVYFKKELGLIYFDVLAKHRLFANYTPFVRGGLNLDLPLFKPGITASYGGYSNLKVGLNTDIVLIDALRIQLGTNNILGALVPSSSTALDAYAGLKLRF